MLKCLAANGFWIKARLRECGYDTNGLCGCGQDVTLFHLLWACRCTASLREQWAFSDYILRMVEESPDLALWTTGIPKIDLQGYPQAVSDLRIHWKQDVGQTSMFEDTSFGDGSGLPGITIQKRSHWLELHEVQDVAAVNMTAQMEERRS